MLRGRGLILSVIGRRLRPISVFLYDLCDLCG